MKYILLMQFPVGAWKTDAMGLWPPDDVKRHLAFLKAWSQKLTESGELVGSQGLAGWETARLVTATSDKASTVTDGPFPESKEFLAGYSIIDVETPARAYEIAASLSRGPGPGGKPLNIPIEVRPVMTGMPEHGG
jgi:hypothetical protein